MTMIVLNAVLLSIPRDAKVNRSWRFGSVPTNLVSENYYAGQPKKKNLPNISMLRQILSANFNRLEIIN